MFRLWVISFRLLGLFCVRILKEKVAKSSLPPANEVWGKVIVSVACVKNSVHGGGVCLCMLGYHTPPEADTPPGTVHAGRYGQQAGSMHPTGMQSCFWLNSPFLLSGCLQNVISQQLLLTGGSDRVPTFSD